MCLQCRNKEPDPITMLFTVSSEWFKPFKICYLLHNVRVSGKSASSDVKAAKEFLEKFR